MPWRNLWLGQEKGMDASPRTGTGSDAPLRSRPQWRCQEESLSHCVVKVNYAPLERKKVYLAWG